MPNSVEGLSFGDFSVDDWEKILKDVSQGNSARPPVEFLFDFGCSDDDQVADDNKDHNVSQEAQNKIVPTGPDDSGVEIGQESEQEGVPVVFVPNKNVGDEENLLQEAGIELSFCGHSVIEDKEPTNNGYSTYLQDAENFPPLGSLQTQDAERSRKRRRKRKQHQRSGDVPCSSSEDSDRDKSPASIVERVPRVRSGSALAGSEKGSGVTEKRGENQGISENAVKKGETGQENKKTNKESHDASSTDSKSTTETVLSIGDSSSSPPQSDVDFHTSKLPQDNPNTTATVTNNSTSETSPIPSEPSNKPSNAAPVSLWADLFRSTSSKQPTNKVETNNVIAPKEPVKDNNVKKIEESVPRVIDIAEDKRALKIAESLKKLSLDYTHKPLFLRGLINKANWCYINATLQALLTCPPFFNLLRQLQPLKDKESTSTPILDSMVKFSHEFNILPKSAATQGKNGKVEFRTGSSFEPNYVYKMLSTIQSSLSAKGRQEDAEEFLSCVLNGIHEELLQLKKLLEPTTKPEPTATDQTATDNPGIVAVSGQDIDKNDDDDDSGDWEQVGPRNKSSITRMAIFPQSLVSDIFGGYLRSSLHQAGAKESANVEPFFDLQLDIQNVSCIEDALNHLAVKEELQGYTCSKTNAQIDISRRVTFESLPKILILHLKRFIYSKSGSQKLLKHVDYPLDLTIGKELLSLNVKNKYSIAQKNYKLIAVVYHHGKTACGGHYTTDMHHPIHGWVRADDTKLKSVPLNHVLKPIQGKDPYLLYYCRTDQMA